MSNKKIPKKIQDILSKYKTKEILEAIELYKNKKQRNLYRKSMKKPVNSKEKVLKIIKEYNKNIGNKNKTLVICHGHIHRKKFKDALLLNRANIQKPNIVSNAWDKKIMKYLPKEYFDIIIMEHCPLGNPFDEKNKQLWKNLYRILKKGGKIINSSILGLYSVQTTNIWYDDMKKIDKIKIKRKVNEYIKKMKFRDIKYAKNPEEKGDEITTIIK
jgi:predicted methyltransferase